MITTLVLCILLGTALILPAIMMAAGKADGLIWILPLTALLTLGGVWLFGVRGFAIKDHILEIERPCWRTRLPLKGLRNAYSSPAAMKGSFKTFGNGGMFAFAGWFRSRTLGRFRAFVTDTSRCVVLEFEKQKIVVSPDDPEAFLDALNVEAETRRRFV